MKKKTTTLKGEDAYAPIAFDPPKAKAKSKDYRRTSIQDSTGPTTPVTRVRPGPTFNPALDKLVHSPDCKFLVALKSGPEPGANPYPFDPSCEKCKEIINTIPKPGKKVKS